VTVCSISYRLVIKAAVYTFVKEGIGEKSKRQRREIEEKELLN